MSRNRQRMVALLTRPTLDLTKLPRRLPIGLQQLNTVRTLALVSKYSRTRISRNRQRTGALELAEFGPLPV
jgi:hypothetical protein